ncbi:MAG: hypothetical protein COA78_10535 [Blastopirellula sp.]|nr:MAG: hypothetical protein COA78_10535 [Blastopirellula sp.]
MNDDPVINPDDNPFSSPEVDTTIAAATDKQAAPSGVVLTVAIVNLLFGIPGLICTGFCVFAAVMMGYHISRGYMPPQIIADYQRSMLWYISMGICICFPALVGFILTGLGLLYRKQWGRILAFVMGPYIIGMGFFTGLTDGPALQDRNITIISTLVMGIVFLSYSILTYSILLRKKYAAEFIAQP